MSQTTGRLPAEFWSSPTVATALAHCDFATLLEQIRQGHGWSQEELATAVGYSQSWVSKVMRRSQTLTIDQAREISRRLGVPIHLLRFGDSGGDDPTKRRNFNKAIALAAFAPLPTHVEVDEATARSLMAITGGQRRLDGTTPAHELVRGVTAHVDMANRILARAHTSPFATDLAAAISEASGFTAWLRADMYDIGTARTYYRLSIDRARRAESNMLTAYMLGSLAAFEIDDGDAESSPSLIAEARRHVGETTHPTPRAWLASLEALGHAAARSDDASASRALLEAERAIEETDVSTSPPWPWMFPFDPPKLASYRARVAVRLNQPDEALAAFAESLPATYPAPKQRALVMLEVATAVRQSGTNEKDSDKCQEAFRLASEALSIGTTYSSERVIQRARRFRRGYDGPVINRVRAFDQQLHANMV